VKKLHFVIIGAHPDDPDGACGGLAKLMRLKGHDVTLVSATDGSAGHHDRGAHSASKDTNVFFRCFHNQTPSFVLRCYCIAHTNNAAKRGRVS